MILDGKTLADASTQDEMLDMERARKRQEAMSQFTQMARQAAQEQAAQQAAQDPLNAIQRQIAYNLVGAKQAYKDALANGDTEGMAAAHGAADSFRSQGNAIGWNGDGYGQGVTLEQAAQNLANNDARALANIFYNQQNADDHYTMEIANLLDKGYSIDSAKRMAAQSADRLDRRNNAELIDSFATYGLDPRGVLTNNGVRILGELAQNGNSELANFYANMYAKPINEYDYQNQIAKMGITQKDLLERMARQNDYATQARQENFQNSEKMAILNNSLGLNREIQLMQARVMAGVMQKDAAHQWLVNKYMAAGLDEQSANVAALTSLNSRGGKGATGGFNKDLAKELRETANSLYEQAEAAELAGDKNRAAQLRQQADQYMAQHTAMLGGGKSDSGDNMFGVDVNNYDSLQDAFQKLINLNAKRPWNEQKTKAELVEIFLNKVGTNNPMAQDIVAKAEWGDSSETPAEKPAEQPRQEPTTPRDDEPSTSSENIGYKDNRSAAGRIWDAVTGALAPGWVKVRRNGQDMTISRAALKPDDEIIE